MVMFWDKVASVYDLYSNFYNGKVNRALCQVVAKQVSGNDEVLECACGTGMISIHIAKRCRRLVATDYSDGMLKKAARKCSDLPNVEIRKADILQLDFPDESFDVVIAANVIHLLDEPLKALGELNRVCSRSGKLVIPTYVNNEKTGETSGLAKTVGKAGADFKRQFTYSMYGRFFEDAGFRDVETVLINGRVPCAVVVMRRREENR